MIIRVRSYIAAILSCVLFLLNQPLIAQFAPRYRSGPLDNMSGGSGLVGSVSFPFVIFSLLMGAAAGAFFSQRFKKYRRWILLGIASLIALSILFLGAPLAYTGWWLIGFVGAWFWLRVPGVAGKQVKLTTYGSAEWADLAHLVQNNLIANLGFCLGTFITPEGRRYPITYAGDRHIMTLAPSRKGKGVSAVIPTLLTWQGSAIIIDPKGEDTMITAKQREKMGQAVYRVDPWGITGAGAARFNPIDWLKVDDPDVGENALLLADALVSRSGGGDSAFWDNEAIGMAWGLILYCALAPSLDVERSLGGVRDLINLPEESFEELLKKMYEHPNNIISGMAARTLGKEPKLRSNVLATLQAHTHFLDSPRMRESLSASDFKFEDLKTSKMTVYLILPGDRLQAFGPWLRLLIQQAITVNARNIEEKPDKPILFMLDELAALGKLSKVEEAYGLMAGYGMQLWGIVQDLSQLDRLYDKGWETFIANCGVLQYFGSRDVKTSEYFSKLCGMSTIQKVSLSRTIARAFGAGGSSSTTTAEGTNTDHIQRPLAFADELMRMPDDQGLVIVENLNPINTERLYWYKDERLKHLGVNLESRTS
jgi:type IV secretion system protein VirD4